MQNLHQTKSFAFSAICARRENPDFMRGCYSCRQIARDIATGMCRTGRENSMFFLMRMAFWLGLVLVLLPTEKTPEEAKLPQIGATEAVTAAGAAMSDMSQFCVRQPAACEIGSQAATVIGHRAQAGARKVYQMITDKKPDHTGSIGGRDDASQHAPADTLTLDDLKADWRGPIADVAAGVRRG
jgi:hypothetical protein